MLKKLTEKKFSMTKKIARERSAADVCSIMCGGACIENDPEFVKFSMNIELRLFP